MNIFELLLLASVESVKIKIKQKAQVVQLLFLFRARYFTPLVGLPYAFGIGVAVPACPRRPPAHADRVDPGSEGGLIPNLSSICLNIQRGEL